MGSSQSSLEQGTASIIPPDSGGSAAAADDGKNSVQLSATRNSNGGDSPRRNGASMQSQQHRMSYTPPTSPIKPLAHYIFLVHGWLGNDLEMAYLSKAFRRLISPLPDGEEGIDGSVESSGIPDAKRVRRSSSYQSRLLAEHYVNSASEECEIDTEIVVHSVKCNVGKTSDGIRNGGTRLANEIVDFIRTDVEKRLADGGENKGENEEDTKHVTYSIVGNSLGGLYARYAVSLLPYQLRLQQGTKMLNLHPNIFCTTATPHLGVSRHTYLPIPRIAETIIGTGMGTTGRDLFRLNSEKDLASAAAGGIMNAAAGGVRRLSAMRRGESNGDIDGANADILRNNEGDELECIIHNMCVQDKYLTPLRNFRQRIAYANAYGTDFQVPTLTAAFLNEKSGVGHFVVASRQASSAEGKAGGNEETGEEQEGLPPFIVAVLRTEKQSQPQSPTKSNSRGVTPSDELLRMSQSLDALGWTKIFIDVRDRIPVSGLARPRWLRPPCGSLDDLIRERGELGFTSLDSADTNTESAASNAAANASTNPPKVETSECILTSQELAQSTQTGDSINIPLGHTVMVANSKSEWYSQLNKKGRPVMDRLAEELVRLAEEFE
eukprot:CAMPEP_0172297290 /NCGR_PEP_ID=MMETSP1058-20130122/371_1 /TAXON_ID=83371 /ORGANISM="Detonula confervacea, Strain CCMP 353" /LENGTH=606 /DNA_ID=CAMNT_0013006423 /DNA_START=270 /DNA_END=2090 /DNA_ORIENTATION=-